MLVANGTAGLAYDKVSVALVPATLAADANDSATEMQNVYGMWVYGGSAPAVRLLVSCVAGIAATLLAAAAWFGWQSRHLVMGRTVLGLRLPGRDAPPPPLKLR